LAGDYACFSKDGYGKEGESMSCKKALVTGASRGLGKEMAILLAENGYNVGVNYKSSKADAMQVCELIKQRGGMGVPLQANVGEAKDRERMFNQFLEAFGEIDLLVNNAGITLFKPFLETTEEQWEELTNTDWKGAYFCAQAAARHMIQSGRHGSIINITSIHQNCQFPEASIYGPTKAALDKFTKHAALELAPYGIRVNSIAPGCIKIRENQEISERGKMLSSRIPLQRLGETREIAEAVLYLSSAKYITGECLIIDGGALLPALLDHHY
jgi:NAD(P)-dependent dehydrogenase (short-subunit alcohol dehydrogenase family)